MGWGALGSTSPRLEKHGPQKSQTHGSLNSADRFFFKAPEGCSRLMSAGRPSDNVAKSIARIAEHIARIVEDL
ncbi:hypothetical protein CDL15_Pgr010994 [Punica granatum]|uniref:Uncharacterized protein n=1 Tax=Punica granatum TaxID=22663 RepID=A0A218XMZ6_PUNGR|nr:hypothetical protein CDL15_Pgr010994 [Punica granatum]